MRLELDLDLQAFAEDAEFASIGDLIIDRAVSKVADRLARDLQPTVEKLVSERAIVRIDAILGDLEMKSFRKTNSYGEPIGDPRTFLELILESIDQWAKTKVNYDGRPSSSGSNQTRIEWLAHKLADDIAKEHLKEAMDELRAAASGKVGEMVRAGIESVFGLKKR